MISRTAFEEAAAKIPYQYRHPVMLHGLVRWLKPRTVVEVGTHLGMSAVWMARGLQENFSGHLWCIDYFCWPEHDDGRQWAANLGACGVMDTVTLIKGRSQEVEWPASVDMAYIDANHSYAGCKHDAEKARDLGASCIVLKATVEFSGIARFSEEMRKWPGWDFLEVVFDLGLLIALRREPKPAPGHGDFDDWDKA